MAERKVDHTHLVGFDVLEVLAFEGAELGPLAHGLIVRRDEVTAEPCVP
jgi:hypothetical protein